MCLCMPAALRSVRTIEHQMHSWHADSPRETLLSKSNQRTARILYFKQNIIVKLSQHTRRPDISSPTGGVCGWLA